MIAASKLKTLCPQSKQDREAEQSPKSRKAISFFFFQMAKGTVSVPHCGHCHSVRRKPMKNINPSRAKKEKQTSSSDQRISFRGVKGEEEEEQKK